MTAYTYDGVADRAASGPTALAFQKAESGTYRWDNSQLAPESPQAPFAEELAEVVVNEVKCQFRDMRVWLARELQENVKSLTRPSQAEQRFPFDEQSAWSVVTGPSANSVPPAFSSPAEQDEPTLKRESSRLWVEEEVKKDQLLKVIRATIADGKLIKGKLSSREGTTETAIQSEQRRADWDERMSREFRKLTSSYMALSQSVAPPRTALGKVVSSHWFGLLVSIVIIANAVWIGVETEESMRRAIDEGGEHKKSQVYIIANYIFSGFFFCELVLSVVVLRARFFIGPGWQWNVFDSFLVGLSLIDIVSEPNSGHGKGYIRVLRVIRMARVLRLIRVFRLFRELRHMCMSLMSCLVSLVWALVLLFLIVYIFAVVFMQAGVIELQDHRAELPAWKEYWSSLGTSFLTLTKAISGGENWGVLAHPLEEVSWVYVAIFVFYVIFIIFGALNVLTGVFMQRAAETMNHDRDWLTQEEKIRMENFVQNLTVLFQELDLSASGKITWQNFLQAMENPSTQAFFVSHDLDIFDAHLVFNVVASKDGTVNIVDFVKGCSRAAGYAKSAHLMALMKETEALHRDVIKAFTALDQSINGKPRSPDPPAEEAESLDAMQT